MDFVFEENPLFDPPFVSLKKIKLTGSDLEAAQEILAEAILLGSKEKIEEALNSGATIKTSSKCRGERVASFALKNFNKDVVDYLLSEGLGVGFIDTLAVETLKNSTPEAFDWLVDYASQKKIALPWHRLVSAVLGEKDVEKTAKVLKIASVKQPDSVTLTGKYSYRNLNSYVLANTVTECIKARDVASFKSIWGCVASIEKPTEKISNGHISYASFLSTMMNYHFAKYSYNDFAFMDKLFTAVPGFKKAFDNEFPVTGSFATPSGMILPDAPENVSKLTHTNVLEYLVGRGAPVAADLARLSTGREVLKKIFEKNSGYLYAFTRQASSSTLEGVYVALKDYFKSWRDHSGNNLAHVLLAQSSTRSSAEFCYRVMKDLLKEENSLGKAPLDYTDKSTQIAIGKKLLKRTLNDKKLGLIHNRKKQQRKM